MNTSTPVRLGASLIVGAVLAAALTAAGTMAPTASQTAPLSELWQDPGDISSRNLRWGRGGKELAPSPDIDYEFKALDATGYSAGYDVTDPAGRKWDVKTGDEGQPEVVTSRLFWAVGYHQPIAYFMPEWKMKGGPVPKPFSGRFRLASDHDSIGEWSWTDNPFKGTRQLKGLVIANLLVNNWDLKPSNNRLYSVTANRGPKRWFVVQDIGASFGKTGWPVGNRNSVADFESQKFVLGVEDGRVQFDYQARHKELLEDIAPADVVWICQLFSRITDTQWEDLFAGAAFPQEIGERYIGKIKSKIQEGLALRARTSGK